MKTLSPSLVQTPGSGASFCSKPYRQLISGCLNEHHYPAAIQLLDACLAGNTELPASALSTIFNNLCVNSYDNTKKRPSPTQAIAEVPQTAPASVHDLLDPDQAPFVGRNILKRALYKCPSSSLLAFPPTSSTFNGSKNSQANTWLELLSSAFCLRLETDASQNELCGRLILEIAADIIEIDLHQRKDDDLAESILARSLPQSGGYLPYTKVDQLLDEILNHLTLNNTTIEVYVQVQRLLHSMFILVSAGVVDMHSYIWELVLIVKKYDTESLIRFTQTIVSPSMKLQLLDMLFNIIYSIPHSTSDQPLAHTKIIDTYMLCTPSDHKPDSIWKMIYILNALLQTFLNCQIEDESTDPEAGSDGTRLSERRWTEARTSFGKLERWVKRVLPQDDESLEGRKVRATLTFMKDMFVG